jgi:DNA-binding NtrC family response regulator
MTPKTILLVDDDAQHLKLYALVLKRAGYRPITTIVGSLSFGMHEHENPALIFLDYRLNSTLNARQLAGLLKEKFPHSPLVVLSGVDTLPEDMKDVADDFLRKGEPEDLVAMANKMLKNVDDSDSPTKRDRTGT